MTEAEYEELSRQADEASYRGDKGRAGELLEKGRTAARDEGHRAFEEFFQGELCLVDNDYGAARKRYERAASLHPTSPLFQRCYGVALFLLGKHEQAIDPFDRALALRPNDYIAMRNKGTALDRIGRHEQAQTWFEKALALEPTDYHSLREMGLSLSHLGRYEEAISWFDKALAVNGGDLGSLIGKGTALVNSDRTDDAIACFDQALAIDSDDLEALRGKAVALANMERLDRALGALDKALSVAPNDPLSLAHKGALLSRMGRSAEGLDLLEKALTISRDDWQVMSHMGTALLRLDRLEDAIWFLDRVLGLNPRDYNALRNKGAALAQLGKHAEATKWFDKALSVKPNDQPSLREKAASLVVLGNPEAALECLERALSHNPQDSATLAEKGVALFHLRRREQAVEAFDNALSIDPRDAQTLRNKAFALHSMGHRDEAKQAIVESLKIEPKNEFARLFHLFIEASPKASQEMDEQDRRRRDDEMQRAVLRAKLEAWEALTARSAHRIGNQTFGIRGSLRELSFANLTPEAKEEMKWIAGCVSRIERILDEFKRFVSPTKPTLQGCDPCDLMRKATRHLAGELQSVNLECDFPARAIAIDADPELIQEGIQELLINAVRALNGRGSIKLKVAVATEFPAQLLAKARQRPYGVLSVEDTGPGIRPEQADRIFEPFFSTTAGGTGLGLSIVRKSVEAQDGAIRETGTYGKGARFEIYLPLKGGDSDVQGPDR
jgi:tetratricopeptide (TPR) repeat protein